MFATGRICRYEDSLGVVVLVIFHLKTIVLYIMVIRPPLVGAYCTYGLLKHVIASSVSLWYILWDGNCMLMYLVDLCLGSFVSWRKMFRVRRLWMVVGWWVGGGLGGLY